MGVAEWIVITLLVAWVIIRDRSIWPMIFGSSVGAPYLVDSYELSWIPPEIITIFKKYMNIAVPKLKESAKKELTKKDIDDFEASMKKFSNDPAFKNVMSASGARSGDSTQSKTSGYIIPPAWGNQIRNTIPPQWFVTA